MRKSTLPIEAQTEATNAVRAFFSKREQIVTGKVDGNKLLIQVEADLGNGEGMQNVELPFTFNRDASRAIWSSDTPLPEYCRVKVYLIVAPRDKGFTYRASMRRYDSNDASGNYVGGLAVYLSLRAVLDAIGSIHASRATVSARAIATAKAEAALDAEW